MKAWICMAEEFLELYGKVEAVVRNCLLRWSGHLFEVPSTHFFDQCFCFKHITLFYVPIGAFFRWCKYVRSRWLASRVPAQGHGASDSNLYGSVILIYVQGLGLCPLPVFCPVLSLAVFLTCWPQILGRPTLVYLSNVLSNVCAPPTGFWTMDILAVNLHWWGVNNRWRKKGRRKERNINKYAYANFHKFYK